MNKALVITAIFCSSLSFAQSDHTGNGKLISEGDQKVLADLSTTIYGRCDVFATQGLLKMYGIDAKMNAVLASLEKLHPLMGYLVRKEVFGMNWCITEHLKKYDTQDEDSISVNYLPESQIGIRDLNRQLTYLDRNEISKLKNKDHLVMALIHETMHSFINSREHRTSIIRTVVHSIYDLHQNFTRYFSSNDNVTLLTMNFNAMLKITGLNESFERISVGNLWSKYLALPYLPITKATRFKYLESMNLNAKHPDRLVLLIANDFGMAHVLSDEPYFSEMIQWKTEPLTSFLPDSYAIGRKVNLISVLEKGSIIPHGYRMLPLGICQIGIKTTLHEFGSLSEVAVRVNKAGRKLIDTVIYLDHNPFPENTFIVDQSKKTFEAALQSLGKLLARGTCDNPNSTGRILGF